MRFCRTPGRVSTHGRSETVTMRDGGAPDGRSVAGSTPPVRIASSVTPFRLEMAWTQPFGRYPTLPAVTVPKSSEIPPSSTKTSSSPA